MARLAQRAGIGRLILVHIDPLAEGDDPLAIRAAQTIFPNIVLGNDLMEIDF